MSIIYEMGRVLKLIGGISIIALFYNIIKRKDKEIKRLKQETRQFEQSNSINFSTDNISYKCYNVGYFLEQYESNENIKQLTDSNITIRPENESLYMFIGEVPFNITSEDEWVQSRKHKRKLSSGDSVQIKPYWEKLLENSSLEELEDRISNKKIIYVQFRME